MLRRLDPRTYLRALRGDRGDRPASASPGERPPIDTAAYWRSRLSSNPGLRGTGTSYMPDAWQDWLYHAKERAYFPLLARNKVELAGASVLDFGCGTGYFEDVWQRAGANTIAGVDIVPETIERLGRAHPERQYVCADLAREIDVLAALGSFDLVTAIDVLYHVVTDEDLERVLDAILARMRPGGHFLFTDALVASSRDAHVRFRDAAWWTRAMADRGLRIVDREPVALLHNRPNALGRVFPSVVGAVQFYADAVLLRALPARANNWALLATR